MLLFLIFKIYVYESFTCMYVHYMYAWYSWRPAEGDGSLGTGLRDSCELPFESWELGSSPERPASLDVSHLSSPCKLFLIMVFYHTRESN